MSYILDALKKAERDRLRDDPQKLDDFTSAAWDPYQPVITKHLSSKTIIAVVVISTCFFLIVFSSGKFRLPYLQDETTDEVKLELSLLEKNSTDEEQARTSKLSVPPVEIEVVASNLVPEPDFLIAGHIFIKQGSSSNRLFIGDGSYKEGEILDANWTLVTINSDHFVIQAGKRVEVIAYR
tara:strand:+ start:666 stop:1208 length:543 start_codon:yes stop_codon:yes gene_type:complete